MRKIAFAKRNLKELSRDVLGYIFCIAFPIVMLIIMSVVNESIPAKANMTTFRIDNLSGGIILFGQTFVMLFTAILVSTDKNTSFLTRLFSSPMKGSDFTLGYILPMIAIEIVQTIVTFFASVCIAGLTGNSLELPGLLLAIVTTLPSGIMFIAIGLIFGTLLNEKSAPGICSVIVSAATFLGGVFFDAEGVGGAIHTVCKCLPFIYCTRVGRASVKLDLGADTFLLPLAVTSFAAIVFTSLAIFVFNKKMKCD